MKANMQIEKEFNGNTYVQAPAEKVYSTGTSACDGCALFAEYDKNPDHECPENMVEGAEGCTKKPIIWKLKEKEMTLDALLNKDAKAVGVKYDTNKERYDLVPILAEEEIAKVFTYGANKYNEAYDEENWRKLQNQERRLYSAARRHIQAVQKGELYDKESGLHHYAHACSNLMMLMTLHLEHDLEV